MRKIRRELFFLPEDLHIESFLQSFDSMYQFHDNGIEERFEEFYDSYDWRLFKKGYLLSRRARSLFLSAPQEKTLSGEIRTTKKTFLVNDCSPGELREKLEPMVSMRALLHILSITLQSRDIRLRNEDQKTVLNIEVAESQVTGNSKESALPTLIYLTEVRGYRKAFTQLSELFKENGLQIVDDTTSLFRLALEKIERKPFDYSSKFQITLDKKATIQQTVNHICQNLKMAMEKNISGVIKDIDTEFLHDFRIAVRRTRSLLSQMKKVLPPDKYLFFQDEFKWLGTITGPVRDLDVYLLMRGHYQSMLPAQLHSGLEKFFTDLEQQRKRRFATMRTSLRSERYQILMSQWSDFLSGDLGGSEWAAKERLCYPLAIKIIRKRLRRVLTDGNLIDDDTPDESLHRLRIQGKKLRYLLEFFRSYFDSADVEFILKKLRKLQNNLGDFNDISVQQDMLTNYQSKLSDRSKNSIDIAAALGGLIAHLSEEHAQVRKSFNEAFATIARQDNQKKIQTILSTDAG